MSKLIKLDPYILFNAAFIQEEYTLKESQSELLLKIGWKMKACEFL